MSAPPLASSAQRVQDALAATGSDAQVFELTASCRTAAEAAQALAIDVGQIAKSIIFKGAQSGRAVLVVTSGRNRVDEKKVAALVGEKLQKADADFVREQTGYAIGGVPPLAHANPGTVVFDQDLLQYPQVCPAGGTPNALFRIAPDALLRITGAIAGNVKTDAAP